MNFTRIAIAAVCVGLSASAFAGPDWDVIQRARMAGQVQAKTRAATDPCTLPIHPVSSSGLPAEIGQRLQGSQQQ